MGAKNLNNNIKKYSDQINTMLMQDQLTLRKHYSVHAGSDYSEQKQYNVQAGSD